MALTKPNYYFNNGFVFQNTNDSIVDNGIITINYLLSSKCQLDCVYCIAKDVIRDYEMPNINQVNEAIEKIIKLDSLVTVLSGGEPLLSPYLKYVIEKLSGNTNIIVDSNGLLLNEQDIEFFRKHNVVFRVSIDVPDDMNEITRVSPYCKSVPLLFNNLKHLYNQDYCFIVSTVISNYNADKLNNMLVALFLHAPVVGWRLQNIIPCHNIDFSKYINDDNNNPRNFSDVKRQLIETLKEFKKLVPHRSFFTMQISDNTPDHSTIFIMPDGSLSISNRTNLTREVLTQDKLDSSIDTSSHLDRYVLNKRLY